MLLNGKFKIGRVFFKIDDNKFLYYRIVFCVFCIACILASLSMVASDCIYSIED